MAAKASPPASSRCPAQCLRPPGADYRAAVLGGCGNRASPSRRRIPDFWRRYVGLHGAVIGIDRFGESAPAGQLFDLFGFSVCQRHCNVARALVSRLPSVISRQRTIPPIPAAAASVGEFPEGLNRPLPAIAVLGGPAAKIFRPRDGSDRGACGKMLQRVDEPEQAGINHHRGNQTCHATPKSSPRWAPPSSTEVLERLVTAGIDVVRLNFSHGSSGTIWSAPPASAKSPPSRTHGRYSRRPGDRRFVSASSRTARFCWSPVKAFIRRQVCHGQPGAVGLVTWICRKTSSPATSCCSTTAV